MGSIKNSIKKIIPPSIKKVYANYKMHKEEKMFAGEGVQCTLCGAEYREFGPYGNFNRRNAYCFNCGSLERQRLFWLYLNNKINILGKKITLLHVAPEKALFEKFIKFPNIQYHPCDLRVELYNYTNGPKPIEVNIENIPFDDETFDFIICSHVLEHVPNDNLAMSELFRVMKHGGSGIIQAPIDYKRETTYEDEAIVNPLERTKAFGQEDHLRWYGRDYPKKLEAVGFSVVEDDYVNSFDAAEQFKYGLNKNELIYYCKKL